MQNYISKEIINDILDCSNILDIISENIYLKKNGNNFMGLCPFHDEKTPSFTVSSEKQIYHCFGCGAGGNILTFLMEFENITFPEAVIIVANRYGIKINKKQKKTNLNLLLKINYDAMIFFKQNLKKDKLGKIAINYLKERGIKKETIKNFNIGYSSIQHHKLEKFLIDNNWKKEEILISKLINLEKTRNKTYGQFRNRIIFPISDNRNFIIGFGGRTIGESMPKYLNSNETIAYNKSKSLYGINFAANKCRETKTIFIVEGYFDLISLHQSGISNSVATLGTAITVQQIRQIKNMIGDSGTVFLAYDADQAGAKAVYRSLDIFRKELINLKIINLPKGFDPDSYIIKFGIKNFIDQSKQAIRPFTFMIEREISKNGLNPYGKIKTINNLKPLIVSNENNLSKSLEIQELASRMNIDEFIIQEEINNFAKIKLLKNTNNHFYKTQIEKFKHNKLSLSRTYRIEYLITAMIIHFPKIIKLIKKNNLITYFENKTLKNIATLRINYYLNKNLSLNKLLEKCKNKKEVSMIAELSLIKEKWDEEGCILLLKQFKNLIKKQNNFMLKEITKAEKEGNTKLVTKLLKKIIDKK